MLYVGIDWSELKHDVGIDNHHGATITCFSIPHTWEGFCSLHKQLSALVAQPSDCWVGIETGYNMIVDFLVDHGYPIYILPPRTTKILRKAKRASGAYDDRSDAQLIAHTLRTQPNLLVPWRPNSALTQRIGVHVNMIEQLRETIHRMQARLRASLMRTFPAALDMFDLRTLFALQFLNAFPTYVEARRLRKGDFLAFFQERHYHRTARSLSRYDRLQQPFAQASPAAVGAHRDQVILWTGLLLVLRYQRSLAISQLKRLFRQHPDQKIFASLPGAGDLLAPALLAKLGDHRERFPTANVLQAFAGTCPVTYTSGKRTVSHFRTSCDHAFRRITQQFAKCSTHYCDWANTYRRDAYRRRGSMSQATRMLANRWLSIIWKMWQTRRPYEESYHLRQRALHSRPSP